jgi:hypothetical protein
MTPEEQPPITEQLRQWSDGRTTGADDALLNLVYAELHRQAHRYLKRERIGHTLQTTALVHEAYLKLQIKNLSSGKVVRSSMGSPRHSCDAS